MSTGRYDVCSCLGFIRFDRNVATGREGALAMCKQEQQQGVVPEESEGSGVLRQWEVDGNLIDGR